MIISLDLHYVDELIKVREDLHGGQPGAPVKLNGHRQGESLNRSCVVMISALLQGYIEGVFLDASRQVMKRRLKTDESKAKYKQTIRNLGNPNLDNIRRLFNRIAIDDVFDGLSWQNCTTSTVHKKLDSLNQLRNGIAHGAKDLKIENVVTSLSLTTVKNYRSFAEVFGDKFQDHVNSKL